MPALIENMANCAIWWLRGSLNENATFFAVLSFQASLIVYAFSTVVSALVQTFKTAEMRL